MIKAHTTLVQQRLCVPLLRAVWRGMCTLFEVRAGWPVRCFGKSTTNDQRKRRTMMKKLIPAVYFQKKANGPTAPSKDPARLELFENELAAVTGGMISTLCRTRCPGTGYDQTDQD